MENYDVFICHSGKDIYIVSKIEEELKNHGISFFIDSELGPGEPWDNNIAENIKNSKVFLFVWTDNSNLSDNIANEVVYACCHKKTIVTFKIGKFEPSGNLELNLIRLSGIEVTELNNLELCSLVNKISQILGVNSKHYTNKGILKIQTDTDCRVFVDNEEKGIARPHHIMRISLCAGSYCLLFESLNDNNCIEDKDFNISANTEQLYNVILKENANCYRPAASEPEESILEVTSDIITPKSEMTPKEMYEKGCIYYWGKGVAKDYKKAVYWFNKAAEKGNDCAMCNLANCYHDGNGVEQDYSKALYWFQKAVEKGNAEAMFNIGVLYLCGNGVSQDYTKVVYWYQKAAEEGVENAMCNLGICYHKGFGVEQNFKKAVYWYQKAAEKGNVEAMFYLGDLYWRGNGVSQDYTKAAYWYQKAAEGGSENAMCNLGICYHKGLGVEQNFKKAVYWYQKAAEKGNFMAINNLGVSYQYGQGVEKNEVIADKLYEARDIVRAGDIDIAIEMVKEILK